MCVYIAGHPECTIEPKAKSQPLAGGPSHQHSLVDSGRKFVQLEKSIRQLERKIKGESGLSMRELRGMARMESTLLHKRELSSVGQPSLADVAHDMGFSDQSHLSREVKRFSGLSLTELQKTIETQESFWPYRSWR
ncbi:helix-turn-helix domain-containing protein [Rhodoferax saidenbachensis]|uniref:AraC-like DNA-binding protein n=1 Tax=Rhodoferax saidenbachensis TaxID=1484693 RepID=A0ABU1ZQ66_9BURK|nr:helix-turn-helix domain-containing protein [Rhodoferax saidenbachensis]MDR7307693.1 AraC-like DNA-binding protein [Rhodoferax saidenbachensis]